MGNAAQSLPLFDANTMTIDELIQYMEGLADKKFKDFHLSLGYFKTKILSARTTHGLLLLRKMINQYAKA